MSIKDERCICDGAENRETLCIDCPRRRAQSAEGSGVSLRERLEYLREYSSSKGPSWRDDLTDAINELAALTKRVSELGAERDAAVRISDAWHDRAVWAEAQIAALTARVAQLESALRDLHDDIVERFDMLNPSTNVGLVNAVEAARAALRGGTEEDSDVHRGAK